MTRAASAEAALFRVRAGADARPCRIAAQPSVWLTAGTHSRLPTIDGRGATFMITRKDLAEWSSAGMVFVSGGLAGHYASLGMSPAQWVGAIAAVLGSVTVAVAVRVWQTPAKAKAGQD